jgi:RimJ/RimL family protein N-acetyltransferase
VSAAPAVPTLAGRRCTLRALQVGDAPAIARHADDEAVWRNLFEGFPRPYTPAHAEAWCGEQHRNPVYGQVWAVDVGGEAIGCCSVRADGGWLRCNAEVGYWIGRAHWRQGVGSEMLALISDWALASQPALTRLYAPIFGHNEASQALARRCGYVLEGRFPLSAIKGGCLIDRVVYGRYRPGAACGPLPTLAP